MVCGGVGFYLGAQSVTVHLGHHHVGDDEVGRRGDNLLQALHAVLAGRDIVVVAQFGCQRFAYLVVVLDDDQRMPAAGVGKLVDGLLGLLFPLVDDHFRDGCLRRCYHLVGGEMGIAQRYHHNEFAAGAVGVVVHADIAVVQFYESSCQVEAYACADMAVGRVRRLLVETLEDMRHHIVGDALAVVVDGYACLAVVVAYANAYLAAGRCELECV